MGSGLLNHLCVTVLPLPEAGWAGGSCPAGTAMAKSPWVSQHSAQHGLQGFQVSAGTGKRFSTPLVVGIWSVSPQAVTEAGLLAKSNWVLT